MLLKKLRQVSLNDETELNAKKRSLERKLKKINEITKKTFSGEPSQTVTSEPSTSSAQPSKKKEKKSKKKVSFNSTVIEYQKPDLDSSSHSIDSDGSSRCNTPIVTVVRQVKIKAEENNRRENVSLADQDEGIEVDSEEKVASELETKRKKENKIMRRKLKELRRKNGSLKTKTSEFLDDIATKRKGDPSHHNESFKKRKKLMDFKIDQVASSLGEVCNISREK